MEEMIDLINSKWSWIGVVATNVVDENDFGNVIFETSEATFFRICPEELKCEKIADNKSELEDLMNTIVFKEDWEMTSLVDLAFASYGALAGGEKYCLKLSATMGGLYEVSNIGKISLEELISFSGELAFQIKDFPDGEKFNLSF